MSTLQTGVSIHCFSNFDPDVHVPLLAADLQRNLAAASLVAGEIAELQDDSATAAERYDGIVQFLEARTPPDCRWEIKPHGLGPAIRVPTDSKFLAASLAGLKRVFDRDPIDALGAFDGIPVLLEGESIQAEQVI